MCAPRVCSSAAYRGVQHGHSFDILVENLDSRCRLMHDAGAGLPLAPLLDFKLQPPPLLLTLLVLLLTLTPPLPLPAALAGLLLLSATAATAAGWGCSGGGAPQGQPPAEGQPSTWPAHSLTPGTPLIWPRNDRHRRGLQVGRVHEQQDARRQPGHAQARLNQTASQSVNECSGGRLPATVAGTLVQQRPAYI